MKLFDLINPCAIVRFFTLYGGGSGGGGTTNPDTRYANLDKLYGVQSQASEFMLDNAMPHIPDLTANSALMNQQAQDGTLATQMREQAGNNATASLGSVLDSNNRNMQRYGMGASANRLLSESNRNAIMGAGMKVGEMNKANMFAEDQKWNRNANFYGQVMGMNNGAMSGLSSAGAGLNSVNAQQNQQDAANAKGYGQAGAAFSNSLFKADGGYIEGESRRVDEKPAKLAKGGDAWTAYKAANPITVSSGSGGRRTNPYAAMLGGAAPQILGVGLKDILNLDGKGGKLVKAGKSAAEYAKHAKEFANGAQDLAQAQEFAAAGQASLDAGYTGAEAFGTAAQGADYASSAQAAADAAEFADTASTASTVAEGATYADTASSFSDASAMWAADGGYIKKPGLKMAVGGLAKSTVANSDKLDSNTMAGMDASNSMSVAKMDDVKGGTKNSQETHAKPTGGKPEDPDGYGKYSEDYRHTAGVIALNRVFPGLGTVFGDTLHPVGDAISRTMINTGDEIGGAGGALMLDPIATVASGKYSGEELLKGAVFGPGGSWLGLANGGEASKDLTTGGPVTGPGTETSDSIPAQLSDGEVVENAEAVKLDPAITKQVIGKWDQKGGDTKDLLLAINEAGLAVRQTKEPVKMAGGGFLGGNLGIALGAGVDQMGRERELDRADRAAKLAENADARAEAYQAPRMESARLENANAQLGLEQGQRQAEIAKAAQKHELGLTDDKYGLLKQELRNKMASGVLTFADAQNQALDHFGKAAETNPAQANRALQDPDFKTLLGFRDAEFIPGTKDGLKITDMEGRSYSTTIGALKTKQPMSIKEVSAGAKLVGVDPKTGKATELAQGSPKPEHADHQRVLVNDAIGQIAMAYGAKLDPITKMLDTSAIKDPEGYTKAIAAAEARVRAGEHPMAVASDIATKGRKEAAVKGLSSKGASTSGGGGYSNLWNK